jgi:hypothetical protein
MSADQSWRNDEMSTPAGWYPQNDGQQRYWDGAQWTEHFAPGASNAAAPLAAPAAAEPKAKRAWYVKKRFLIPGGVVAFFIAIAALSGGGDDATVPASATSPSSSTSSKASTDAKAAPSASSAAPKPAAPKAPALTSGQKNALRSAENYISLMSMSKAGLIQQLSSPAGDGYSKADATYAANHVKADWNAEAVEAANNYMEIMPMSRTALIKQLSSSAGDKFTKAEATKAADAVL